MVNSLNDGLSKPSQLADDAVDTIEILDEQVTTDKIDDLAVTEAKINTAAVTEAKIGAVAVTEAKIGTSAVTNTKIGSNAVTYDKMEYGYIGVGSPIAYGNSMQAGTAELGAGSDVAVTFGMEFAGTPYVIPAYIDSDSSIGVVVAGSITTAGFTAVGDTASKDIHWIAVGSGAI